MDSNKKILLSTVFIAVIICIASGVSFAFFNYTRTGTANTIRVGRIYFNTSQVETINLTNVVPISRNEEDINSQGTDAVTIEIEGDTTYENGIEYLVTAEDVNVTVNNKRIPISLYVSETTDLGNNDADYFENRGGNSSIYKPLAESVIVPGQYLLVGYIAPGATGIDGEVKIKAFIDKEKVLVTDTYPEGRVTHIDDTDPENPIEVFDYTNLTPNSMAEGKVVLTTSEWNSIQGNNALSFKVRVEANEGVWVPEETNPNAMNTFTNLTKTGIIEIRFVKETPIRMQARYENATNKSDLTYNNEGKVLAWQEDDVLYVASSGETYFTTGNALFYGFTDVEKIIFENVNSERVTNMSAMFVYLTNLTDVNIEDLDTSNVTDMSSMFVSCSSLISINLSNLGSSFLNSTSGMFSGCSNLQNINMSGFNFGTSSLSGQFVGLNKLEVLNLSNSITSNVTNMSAMLSGCNSLISVNLSNMGGNSLTNISGMFNGCYSLVEINMSGFDFGTVSMANLFNGLNKLEKINIANADTTEVTNMNSLFSGCLELEKVDLSYLGGNNLSTMVNMFYNCPKLKEINMSGFNFGNATFGVINSTNNSPFISAYYAEKIDLSNANFSNVSTMDNLFNGLSNLKEIDLSGINTQGVTNMSNMFSGCSNISKIDLRNAGGNSLNNTSYMFYNCTKLVEINMSGFNFGTTSMSNQFIDLSNLEKLNLANANTSNVTNMSQVFYRCSKLTDLDISGLNTSNVTTMNGMFSGCSSLVSINISGYGGNSLTNISYIFDGCNSLKEVNMSNFNFNNLEIDIFRRAYNILESIDLSNAQNLNFSDAFSFMFDGNTTVKRINLSGINTSNVTTFQAMFRHCQNLEEIDLSSFNTSNITNFWDMFNDCPKLTTIYVSNSWVVPSLAQHNNNGMFTDCTSLVGGNGTAYHSALTGTQMAVIDAPGTPGYLTLKTV